MGFWREEFLPLRRPPGGGSLGCSRWHSGALFSLTMEPTREQGTLIVYPLQYLSVHLRLKNVQRLNRQSKLR